MGCYPLKGKKYFMQGFPPIRVLETTKDFVVYQDDLGITSAVDKLEWVSLPFQLCQEQDSETVLSEEEIVSCKMTKQEWLNFQDNYPRMDGIKKIKDQYKLSDGRQLWDTWDESECYAFCKLSAIKYLYGIGKKHGELASEEIQKAIVCLEKARAIALKKEAEGDVENDLH